MSALGRLSIRDEALRLSEYGYAVVPLRLGSKLPAIEWKEFQTRKPTAEELRTWFAKGEFFNLGVVCGAISGHLFVKDFDNFDIARSFYRTHRELVRTIVRTRRGVHFYFRSPGSRNTTGDKVDGRGEGGYVVGAGSEVDGFVYEYIHGHDLVPPVELSALVENTRETRERSTSAAPGLSEGDRLRQITRARAYLQSVEPAVSGCRGHDKTLYAACCLIQKFQLNIEEAWPLMLEYNDRCVPPWDLKSLARKLTEAARLKGKEPADLRA